MEQKKHKNSLKTMQCVLLLILVLITCLFSSFASSSISYAAYYSSVMDDLQNDETFNKSIYPRVDDNYTLNVIQIAEGGGGEIFVYVYQPSSYSKLLKASSINISTGIDSELKYQNYKISLVSFQGVFFKYKVEGLGVKDSIVRYYDVSSIFRPYDATIDEKPQESNEISEVSFNVGKVWTACTYNGEVIYMCNETETILITDKYVGFLRYLNGMFLYQNSCDSHFVAFSTDKQIDKLLEADVYYLSREVSTHVSLGIPMSSYGEYQEHSVSLKYTDKVSNPAGLTGNKYTWSRIESVADFVEKEDLTETAKGELEGKEWVLRFAETDYIKTATINGSYQVLNTEVSDVTILRLKFETDGVTYNLGVVDNKQTGDGVPDNIQSLPTLWKILISILIAIFAVMILAAFLPSALLFILEIILKVIKFVFMCFLKLLSLPFKIFKD